ncbi:GxxExxY protein [Flavihumibacter fluvii]|uniref:GxxExxY protein n=1 Tax=Flavihumibacter fluvii TaxID=2838157 RepID=UPI001BDEEE14|nr:GxxExxY protein [Flavihumibacter fluvii]ULQ50785.1 GxxExxY protein [Flavihumibacter fluvii]
MSQNDKSENELAGFVVNCSLKIHRQLGPGLFENVYEKVLWYHCIKEGIKVERQKSVPVIYDGIDMGLTYIPDLIIGDKLIVEVKSVENLLPVHFKQMITYLKITHLKLGLLINFNKPLIK